MGVQPVAARHDLLRAIEVAGGRSGVDFAYLLQTAIRESSLNPAAKAATSTATGLFQFLESTWLEVMKTEGPALGYGQYASAISRTPAGGYAVANKATREEILALREDAVISANLAAAFTRRNGDYLAARFGRNPSAGELYIAHFLGARGAETLFAAGLSDPDKSAAQLFPRQAKANPTIFYADGRERSVREVYVSLVDKHRPAAPTAAFVAQQAGGGVRSAAETSAGALGYAPFAGSVTPAIRDDGIPSRLGPRGYSDRAPNGSGIAGRVHMSSAGR